MGGTAKRRVGGCLDAVPRCFGSGSLGRGCMSEEGMMTSAAVFIGLATRWSQVRWVVGGIGKFKDPWGNEVGRLSNKVGRDDLMRNPPSPTSNPCLSKVI